MSQYAEIAFVDTAVPDLPHILNNLRPGVRAIVLEAAEPAPAQMARALARSRDVEVIHILAHGQPGELSFAAGALSSATLDSHRDDLRDMGRSLAVDGEIRLWACDTAHGAQGATFVEHLAAITGSRIAASTARIGAAVHGGSWQLDAGASQAPAPLTTAGLAGYGGVLTLITDITFTSGGESQVFDGTSLALTFTSTVTVTGSAAGGNDLLIRLSSLATASGGPTVLDMSGWTFVNWNSTDRVRVAMGGGDDTLILGSSSVLGPLDVYDGNGFQPSIQPGEINIIQIGTADTPASVDFSSTSGFGTFLDFSQLAFANNSGTSTATFNSSGVATIIVGSAGTNAVVFKSGADLSGLTFNNWTNGDDSITIFATAANESIIGSSQDDILSIAAATIQSGDLYDGGGGTDTLLITGGGTFDFSGVGQDATHGFHNMEVLAFDGSAASTVTFDGATQFASGLGLSTATVTGSDQAETLRFTRKAGQTGGSYDLSGLQFTDWTGGIDTINILATLGVDNIVGTSQDDIFVFAASAAGTQVNAGDSFDGGSGNDTIQIGTIGAAGLTPIDFSPAILANFERVTFTNTTGARTVTFTSNQFGAGKISNSATITGTSATNAVVVNMATNGSLDMSGWSFAGWTNGTDTLTVNGSTGNDTVTASTAADTILGGAGNDTFIVAATAEVSAGDRFDGGTGNNIVQVGTAGAGTNVILAGASSDGVNGFLNIGGIAFANTSGISTAAFSSAQFGVGKISNSLTVTGSAGTNALVIVMNTPGPPDLSGWTFVNWTTGTDKVTVIGSAAYFSALTATDIVGMAAQGVTAIASNSGNLALTVDQYLHLGSIAVNPPALIRDTAANIEAMTTDQLLGMAAKNIKILQSTDGPLMLSPDQYTSLGGVLLPTDHSTTLQASAADILALSTGFIGGLYAGGVSQLIGTSAVTLSAAQAAALGRVTVSAASATLADTAGNIIGLTNKQLGALADSGFSNIDASDDALTLTTAQFRAIGPVALSAGDTVTVKDTWANVSALDLSTLGAKNVDFITVTNGSFSITAAQYTALLAGGAHLAGPAMATLTGSGIAALDLSGLAANGISKIDASDGQLSLTLDQYTNLNGVQLTAGDTVTLADTSAVIGNLTQSQIGGLAAGGIDQIGVTSPGAALSWGLNQFNALGAVVLESNTALTLNGDVSAAGTNDTFAFSRQPFSASDKINGYGGFDTLQLQGNYGTLAFAADTISSIEKLQLKGGGGMSYSITQNDGNVAAGQSLAVTAASFVASDSAVFDGSGETDGTFSFTGGAAGTSTFTGGSGADTFTGGSGGTTTMTGGGGGDTINAGAGTDTIRYTGYADSNSSAYDLVNGFNGAADSFSWTTALTWDGTVAGGPLRSGSLASDLTAAFSGVAGDHAAVFKATSGNMAGQQFLLINDATAGFQSGSDVVVRLGNATDVSTFTDTTFKVG